MKLNVDEIYKSGIGLTGGIATGKSTVGKIITDLGYLVVDADQLARQVVLPGSTGLQEIVDFFGSEILMPNGELNRVKLRYLVFKDIVAKKMLETITHPKIKTLLLSTIANHRQHDLKKLWFYEAALLIETEQHTLFREIWLTTCHEDLQLQRLIKRNQISELQAKEIINNQKPFSEKCLFANYIIDTAKPLDDIKIELMQKLKQYNTEEH